MKFSGFTFPVHESFGPDREATPKVPDDAGWTASCFLLPRADEGYRPQETQFLAAPGAARRFANGLFLYKHSHGSSTDWSRSPHAVH